MPKIDNSAPPSFDVPGVTFTGIAAPSRGSSETAVWRARLVPGVPSPLHHMTREEIIIATSGTGLVRLAGEEHLLNPGDAFAVPAFTDFQLEPSGSEPFEAMVILPVGGRGVIGTEPSFRPPWSI
ncbi:MAG: cupin domain-containing protein [Devosia sp.]